MEEEFLVAVKPPSPTPAADLCSELLILPDGTILVHNLTPVVAAVLAELNPDDHAMKQRAAPRPGESVSASVLPLS